MLNKMIEAVKEVRYGKERMRMELLSMQTDLDSYKVIAASAAARGDRIDTYYAELHERIAQMHSANTTLRLQLQEQQEYTMVLVKKLNAIRGALAEMLEYSALPTKEEMSDDQ